MLPHSVFGTRTSPSPPVEIKCCLVEDRPSFRWRGMHLDVSRHFMPLDFVKKLIDVISLHKMNRFHWHLTDDQGWRLQIMKYPRLTEIGAWRKETRVGHERDGAGFDGVPHGGFYTQSEVKEVISYAQERHVVIVPEIEMPGHVAAAIAAYPELGNTTAKVEVWPQFGVNHHVLNVEDSTIKFFQDILAEVIALFPGPYIHVGGDECPKDEWKESDLAQKRIRELGLKDEHELQSCFIAQMDSYLHSCGKILIGWDEILEGGLADNAVVMSWRGEQGGVAAARAGHDVVMAPNGYTYFDHYSREDRSQEPLAIGGFLPLDKVYSFDPIPPELSEAEAKHVLGAQAQLWTEYMKTPSHVEYMAFPRVCAVAEVLWSKDLSTKLDFASFSKRLPGHLKRLEALEVNFRKV